MSGNRATIRETAKELLAYSRDVLGADLRVVTRYNPDEHETIFTRDDVPDRLDLDEETRSMFRHPLVRMQKATQELSDHHPTLDGPDVAVYGFGPVTILQFPITEEDGIILTADWEDDLPEEYVSTCKAIACGSE